MKKQSIDSTIKQKLEDTQLSPSTGSWEKLSAQLDKDQARVPYRKIGWSIAALFFLILRLLSYYTLQKNTLILAPTQETITHESIHNTEEWIEPDTKSYDLEEKAVLPQQRQIKPGGETPLLSLTTRKVIQFETNPPTALLDMGIVLRIKLESDSWIASIKEQHLDLEIDSLMELAFDRLKESNSVAARRKETVLRLLDAVENELNHELFLKHKVLRVLKGNNQNTDIVLNDQTPSQLKH